MSQTEKVLPRSFNGHPVCEAGGLEVLEGKPPEERLKGTRIGIPYADPLHREALLRFAVGGSIWVTERRKLISL